MQNTFTFEPLTKTKDHEIKRDSGFNQICFEERGK